MKYSTASTGYATFYGGNTNGNACGMDGTAPAYGNERFVAIGSANFDDGYGCGKCFTLTCTGPYGNNPGCSCGDTPTIKVQAIDQCPECSTDHFDLNADAFAAIVGPGLAGTCGKISVTWDQIPCDEITQNFNVVNKGGTSEWWYGLHLNDVNGAGGIKEVTLYFPDGTQAGTCDKSQGPSFWICSASQGSFNKLPMSIKITSATGESVTAEGCITSLAGGAEMTCNTNLGGGGSSPNPSPTDKPDTTTTTTSSGGGSGTKTKVINKKGLNQWWYAVVLENIPSAGIASVKMKDSKMNSYETGVNEWDYYKFTTNAPYSPPFSFKITSKSGQTITTTNVISDLNEGSSGYMSKAWNSAYTEDGEGDTSTFPVAGIVAIVLVSLIIIGVAGYCFIKRNKQKGAVSFEQGNRDSPAPVVNDGDNDNKTTTKDSGYDMSPIDAEQEIEVDVEVPTPAGDE